MEKKKDINNFFLGAAKHNCLGIEEQTNKYEPEDYNFNIENKNDSHALLAQRVLENSNVLDIGCASGIIGRLLKENKNCTMDGIEVDPVSFELAKKSQIYKNMYHFSITDSKSKEYQEFLKKTKKYDYIILGDILEHLVNPWEVLYHFSKKLNKEGKILISIPNVNHIDIIKNMMNNQFNYNNVGILDSTHLRFFTSLSFFQMMENYNSLYDRPLNVYYFGKTTFKPNYINDLPTLKEESFETIQNLFELSLAESKEKVKYKNRPKEKKNFEAMVEKYRNLQLENEKQQEKIQNLETELSAIYNSKRYKFISKIMDMKNRIKR